MYLLVHIEHIYVNANNYTSKLEGHRKFFYFIYKQTEDKIKWR